MGGEDYNLTVVIPTYNGEKYLKEILNKLVQYNVLIIDSSSSDNTVEIAKQFSNVEVKLISKEDFNHGATRNLALSKLNCEKLVYLTQDAVPISSDAILKLANNLNKNIKIAYGKQIPHEHTGLFGRFARYFNYNDKRQERAKSDASTFGIKTVFNSNSFAVYDRECLIDIGGFPSDVILSEDTYVAASLLNKGFSIVYDPKATVRHSHDYTIKEEFKRYFDIGVFYGSEDWIVNDYSNAEGEGFKFVKEELKYLIKNSKYILLPICIVRNAFKYLGYKLGQNHDKLPKNIKLKFSMHSFYWK